MENEILLDGVISHPERPSHVNEIAQTENETDEKVFRFHQKKVQKPNIKANKPRGCGPGQGGIWGRMELFRTAKKGPQTSGGLKSESQGVMGHGGPGDDKPHQYVLQGGFLLASPRPPHIPPRVPVLRQKLTN